MNNHSEQPLKVVVIPTLPLQDPNIAFLKQKARQDCSCCFGEARAKASRDTKEVSLFLVPASIPAILIHAKAFRLFGLPAVFGHRSETHVQ
jgi:hypothetical protein